MHAAEAKRVAAEVILALGHRVLKLRLALFERIEEPAKMIALRARLLDFARGDVSGGAQLSDALAQLLPLGALRFDLLAHLMGPIPDRLLLLLAALHLLLHLIRAQRGGLRHRFGAV